MRQTISIHALRVEGDALPVDIPQRHNRISIHALRVEGDMSARPQCRPVQISIHALRVEGDHSISRRAFS